MLLEMSNIFLIFPAFLLLDNLLLPAAIGPGSFLITPIFILELIRNFDFRKYSLGSIFILVLIAATISGNKIYQFVGALTFIFLICLVLNKFLNLRESARDDFFLPSVAKGILILFILGLIYSFFFNLLDNSFNLVLSLNEWKMFFATAWLSLVVWCAVITFLFKSNVFKEKNK